MNFFKTYRSHLSVLLGASLWGLIGLFTRPLYAIGLAPINVVAVRNFGGLLVLAAIFAVKDRSVFRIKAKHLPIFFGTGIVSVLLFSFCYFCCQQFCSLAVSAILLYLAPSFVVVMSAILWKDKLTKNKILALLLALVGCALVSGIVGGDLTVTVQGFLFGIGSAFFYALYSIFGRYALAHYGSYTVTVWTFVFAGLGSLVFADIPVLLSALREGKTALIALGLVIVATVLPYIFYTNGLSGLESGVASIIASVEPVVAALVGIFIFREKMTLWVGLGVICVLSGVVLLAGKDKNGKE